MAGIEGIEKLFNRVKRLKNAVKQTERPLRVSAVYMLGSIDKNFAAEGRAEKWKGLADSTKARRRGKRHKILTDTARLRRSHSYRISSGGAEIGTNVIYAPRQHFGYPGGSGRGRSKTPSRKFLMFQEEDIRQIGEIFSRHVRS
ncbi:MAG: phage virion morphogenesis protein [Acidobacteriota bacterium]|nr:phage virion morphogenesis protein [Acidobacteriota bacterium]